MESFCELFIRWIIPETTPEVCLSNLIEAVDRLSESEKMHINKVGSIIYLPTTNDTPSGKKKLR